MVEAAGVAQVVAGAVATPQRRRNGAAVDALAPLQVGRGVFCQQKMFHFDILPGTISFFFLMVFIDFGDISLTIHFNGTLQLVVEKYFLISQHFHLGSSTENWRKNFPSAKFRSVFFTIISIYSV